MSLSLQGHHDPPFCPLRDLSALKIAGQRFLAYDVPYGAGAEFNVAEVHNELQDFVLQAPLLLALDEVGMLRNLCHRTAP